VRNKDFDPEEALDRAMDLFWRNGYASTALDDLVGETGASRYGLYASFGNKRELFVAALERYSRTVMDPMIGSLEAPDASVPDIRAFFRRLLSLIRHSGDKRGCLIVNAAMERPRMDPEAGRRVRRHFSRVHKLMARAITNARRDGVLAPDGSASSHADHLLGAAAGSFFLDRAGMPMPLIRRFVATALQSLD
jgi:TetR/AcrR family transcriptional repressor of nem operon